MRDVMQLNVANANFRLFSPDEFTSNRWNAVLDVTPRLSMAEIRDSDSHLAHDGRVLEVLSEHLCQGWLEGYLLTGRHGSSPATRPSSTSSIRCSTSTRSG